MCVCLDNSSLDSAHILSANEIQLLLTPQGALFFLNRSPPPTVYVIYTMESRISFYMKFWIYSTQYIFLNYHIIYLWEFVKFWWYFQNVRNITARADWAKRIIYFQFLWGKVQANWVKWPVFNNTWSHEYWIGKWNLMFWIKVLITERFLRKYILKMSITNKHTWNRQKKCHEYICIHIYKKGSPNQKRTTVRRGSLRRNVY